MNIADSLSFLLHISWYEQRRNLNQTTIWMTIAARRGRCTLCSPNEDPGGVGRKTGVDGWWRQSVGQVAFAYNFYYGWSQTAAYRDTARKTAEVVGLDWGGGLYINYVVLLRG